MKRAVVAALIVTVGCGPKRPPPSFAPDPGLVEQIREIRMSTSTSACPGESFGAVYTAVLNDGSLVPFETRYDKDNPPRLHVVFLARSSQKHDVQPRRIVLVVARLEGNERPVVQDGGVDRAEGLPRAGARARGHPDLADLLDEPRVGRERRRRPLRPATDGDDQRCDDCPLHGVSSCSNRLVSISKMRIRTTVPGRRASTSRTCTTFLLSLGR